MEGFQHVRLYSVWCEDSSRWCGMSPRGRLELCDRPCVGMMSMDEVGARLRARSLSREFPDHKFTVKEV